MRGGTSQFSESASKAYQLISDTGKKAIVQHSGEKLSLFTDKHIMREGKRLFMRIQKLVYIYLCWYTLRVVTKLAIQWNLQHKEHYEWI